MFSTITSGTLYGIRSCLIQVEVDVSQGLPCFQIVGLPGSEVREARERVKVALKNVGVELPPVSINVNLSPADIPKSGTMFDLPVAVGIMTALSKIPAKAAADTLLIGELGLSGEVKPVKGVLPIVREAARRRIRRCILPAENLWEGSLVEQIESVGVSDMRQAIETLTGVRQTVVCRGAEDNTEQEENGVQIHGVRYDVSQSGTAYSVSEHDERRSRGAANVEELSEDAARTTDSSREDFADISGQESLKRAAEVAAAGFHHLLIVGPPGAGKTMLASRIPTILPPLSAEESLEVSSVYSISGLLRAEDGLKKERPFLNPHHTITGQALVGGGRIPTPGIISLAHRGVLFLGGYFCKTAETPNLRALWRFSYLEFFKKSAKTILHTTFWNCVLPLFDCFFAERFMVADYLMAKPYTIWQKEETKWRNYTRMAKGEGAYGI